MAVLHTISEQTQRFLATTRPLLVGEQWRAGATGQSASAINPATGAAVGQFCVAGVADVEIAVAIARQSFEDGRWRRLTPAAREKCLWRVAELIEANAQMLAELECLDGGKLYVPTLAHEVPQRGAGQLVRALVHGGRRRGPVEQQGRAGSAQLCGAGCASGGGCCCCC